ncbi:hypothetical protein JAO76_02805 [Pontibacter sp. BT310]|uniref:DUF3078 domain-containing protein n=1 Tax=Pontibacter populi TaxID=890055 RepID=A0ABS6X7H6_9BACT|nr:MULTISPECIES: hypothetical protein [Pontibacter]MBJ6117105.1 hypothetical protein [Pontibacter sp. BT310]MBR0569529.1 hypothetical protein [Microvirga sp. STS03]MBW3363958.1 hypothetical protein [Pontibacter populi]
MKNQLYLWIMLAWALVGSAHAQTTEDSVTRKASWNFAIEAANNSSFFGRNTATQYPYAAATLTYAHASGFWVSATSYQLFNTKDYIDETDLSVGYSFAISKRMTGNLSYSRFFFSENAPMVKSVTENAASLNTTLDWKYLYSSLTTSYFFGESNDLIVQFENSRYIGLNPIWNGRNPVGLDPKIGVTGGTQEFSETYTVERKKELGDWFEDVLTPGKGNNPKTTTTTTTKHKFQVLSYDLYVPLVIMLGNFELEPTYRYSIPVNKLEGDESEAKSFVSVKASYTF